LWRSRPGDDTRSRPGEGAILASSPCTCRETMLTAPRLSRCATSPHSWIGAAVDAPRGLVLASAARTGLARLVLIHQDDRNPCCLGLVRHILPGRAMGPQPDLLLAPRRHALLIGDSAHIAYRQGPRAPLPGPVHHRPTDFVLDVAGAPLLLGQEPVLAPLQAL